MSLFELRLERALGGEVLACRRFVIGTHRLDLGSLPCAPDEGGNAGGHEGGNEGGH